MKKNIVRAWILAIALMALFGCTDAVVIDKGHSLLSPQIQVFGLGNVCVPAACRITAGGTTLYAGSLAARMNQLSFDDTASDAIMVTIEKDMYLTYSRQFDHQTMLSFNTNPLLVTLESSGNAEDGLIKITYAVLAEVNSTNPFVRADTYSSTIQTVYMNTPFALANSEVPGALWEEVSSWGLSRDPSVYYIGLYPDAGTAGIPATNDGTQPATWISWHDAARWCNAYSEMTGRDPVYFTDSTFHTVYRNLDPVEQYKQIIYINWSANGYRMPSEAEWEFCARYAKDGGGNVIWTNANAYSGSPVINDVAWYKDNSNNASKPVKSKLANWLGFYDMSGNLMEFCSDYFWVYSGATVHDPRGPDPDATAAWVVRGGNIFCDADWCATGFRGISHEESGRSGGAGFRLARTINE